jgi:hypothetical protein
MPWRALVSEPGADSRAGAGHRNGRLAFDGRGALVQDKAELALETGSAMNDDQTRPPGLERCKRRQTHKTIAAVAAELAYLGREKTSTRPFRHCPAEKRLMFKETSLAETVDDLLDRAEQSSIAV